MIRVYAILLIATVLPVVDQAEAQKATTRAQVLMQLAEARFGGDLTAADKTLFRATANGEIADYGDGSPAESSKWCEDRELRAARIRWLCTDRRAIEAVTHRGVRIKGAIVRGLLDLSFANINFPLSLIESSIPGGITFERADLRDVYLTGTHSGPINADGVTLQGGFVMDGGFRATGKVHLVAATIGIDLNCDGGSFINGTGKALVADRAKIDGSVYLTEGFEATGSVQLRGATIGHSLNCRGGHFSGAPYALDATGLRVGEDVFLDDGFQATGEVRFLGATITGDLDCRGGAFKNPCGIALDASSVRVEQNVFLSDHFSAEGKVRFISATVGGHFEWKNVVKPDKCTLRLETASVGTLSDDAASWPRVLYLDGFVYRHLDSGAPTSSAERLKWLMSGKPASLAPQPFEQLAKVLTSMGHVDDAREILIAKEEEADRHLRPCTPLWLWRKVLGITMAYGHRPSHLLGLMGLCCFLGAVVSYFANRAGHIVSISDRGAIPSFNPLMYSVDTFIPVVDFRQMEFYIPTKGYARVVLWLLTMAGWGLCAILIVGITGLIK